MSQKKNLERTPNMSHDSNALLDWLRGKVTQAENTLETRRRMAGVFRSGTQAQWNAAAVGTDWRPSTRAERMQEAEGHDRIAVQLAHELTMFQRALAALSCAKNQIR